MRRSAPLAATAGAIVACGFGAVLAEPAAGASELALGFERIPLADDDGPSRISLPEAQVSGGSPDEDVGPLIFGGRPTADGEFPFTVYVQIETDDGLGPEFFRCAGSVIAPEWVLTAAHCVTDDDGLPLPNLAVLVAAGVSDVEAGGVPAANIFDATDVFLRGDFNPPGTGYANDLAVLRLDRPVPLRGLPLSRPELAGTEVPGTSGMFTGWGLLRQDPDISTNQMQFGSAPIQTDATCSAYFPFSPFQYVPGIMKCTGPPLGSPPVDPTPCPGDSGGPMFVRFGSDYIQSGIASFAAIPCQGLRRAAYTRVASNAQSIGDLLLFWQPSLGPPEATTGGVTQQHVDGLTVTGTVDPNGIATAYQVDWGTSPALGAGAARGRADELSGTQRLAFGGQGDSPANVSVRISGAPPGTEIFYRVTALSAAGSASGQTLSGQTANAPPPPPQPVVNAPPPPVPTAGEAVCNETPPRRRSEKGTPRFTKQGLAIEQRIAAAALRRLNAANVWINAGIVPSDLCAHAFGPVAFQAGIPWVGGAPAAGADPPSPRDLRIIKKRKPPASFTADLRQVRINDKISRALLARARATWRRINDLTDGNLDDSANLSGRPLFAGLGLGGPLPPSSEANPTPLRIGALPSAGRLRANAAQIRKTQRRTQDAVRLANRVNDRIRAGLTEKQFRDGSIGAARLG